jgi:hypothetical protein
MRRGLPFVVLLAASIADGQSVGSLQFQTPSGWTRVDRPPGMVLVAPGVPPGKSAVLMVSPPEALPADLMTWGRHTWGELRKSWNVERGGELKPGRSRSGLESLTIEAWLGDTQQPGNRYYSYFQALKVGSQVQYFQFLSNAEELLAQHLQGVRAFEASVAASTAPGPAPTARIAGATDLLSPSFTWESMERPKGNAGLDGLYHGVTLGMGSRPGSSVVDFKDSNVYFAFFADGHVYSSLPEEGLENFNISYWHTKNPAWCGTYRLSGSSGEIAFDGDPRRHTLKRSGKMLEVDGVDLAPLDRLDGVRFEGTFRRNDWQTLTDLGKRTYIRFTRDGRFDEQGLFQLANMMWWRPNGYLMPGASPGTGSYQVSNNSLTLIYSDGRKRRSNIRLPDGAARDNPNAFIINNWTFARSP